MSTRRLIPILFLSVLLNAAVMPAPEWVETTDDSDEQIVQPQRDRTAIRRIRRLPAFPRSSQPRVSGIHFRRSARRPPRLPMKVRVIRKIPSPAPDSPAAAETH
jgi:hypothetical protein